MEDKKNVLAVSFITRFASSCFSVSSAIMIIERSYQRGQRKAVVSDNNEIILQDGNFAAPFYRGLLTSASRVTRHKPFT